MSCENGNIFNSDYIVNIRLTKKSLQQHTVICKYFYTILILYCHKSSL